VYLLDNILSSWFNTVIISATEWEVTLSRTLELSRYVVEGDQEQQFLAKRGAMVKVAKETFPGLISVTLAKRRRRLVRRRLDLGGPELL
jgi:hypothetical protein